MQYLHYIAYQLHHLPLVTLAVYLLVVNAITYGAYYYDKYAAIHRRWRVPESTLHLLIFIGGTIGAIMAMQIIRHKTRKRSFQMKACILFVMQACIVLYVKVAF